VEGSSSGAGLATPALEQTQMFVYSKGYHHAEFSSNHNQTRTSLLRYSW